ncbi:MAG: ABC transporter ATP-binding protein [Pseudomonadota bacterium]
MTSTPLLSVEGLSVCFGRPGRVGDTVSGVDFTLGAGQTLALVGESGSGKTLTGKALLGLLPRGAQVSGGRAVFAHDGREIDLLRASSAKLRRLRGTTLAMVFQEPMSALSPLHRVGDQVGEVLRVHGHPDASIKARVLEVFAEVGFPDPERAYTAYPFELSGGLRQRAVIAMAIIGDPALVVADEPTTALDVTTQAMVLDLLGRLQRERGLAVILITHDLGVVANMADSVTVMRQGHVVERGALEAVLARPGHAYTRALIAAAPHVPETLDGPRRANTDTILHAEHLAKTFHKRSGGLFARAGAAFRAVHPMDLTLERGRTVAVVGESGSGKSTLARMLLRAVEPDPGAKIVFRARGGEEQDVIRLGSRALKRYRRAVQMVFQDPYAALSPRMPIQDILAEPLKIHGLGTPSERRERAAAMMKRVGLSPDHLGRFPNAFSGGQRQRIAIARALALDPELLVCDEPTSALDVSVQAEVLALLDELKQGLGLTYLFISHDLAVVSRIADRVLVMRSGRVVEAGSCRCIFQDARHPYTRALIAASPVADPGHRLDLKAVAAGAGAPEDWPDPYRHGTEAPGMVEVGPGHLVRAAA